MYANRTSVCRHCGALVGAGEAACAVCGVAVGGAAAFAVGDDEAAAARRQGAPDYETLRFASAVLTRPATFTFVLLTINIFIFLLMSLYSDTNNFEVLRAFGAKYNSLINEGEWWRLVTPVFLHIGWLHLLVNMYSLFMLGPYVERLYGSAKFVSFWVLTGVAGVAASYFASGTGMRPTGFIGQFLFRGGDGPSAGASGALFGLIGVLFVFGIKFRHELPEGFKRAFGTGMLPTILINLFIGYSIPYIDNAAHLGGFAAGAALALFVGYKRPGSRGPVAVAWHVLQVALLIIVVASFGEVARHFAGPRPSLDNLTGGVRQVNPAGVSPEVKTYLAAINAGNGVFAPALQGNAQGANQVIEILERAPQLDAQTVELNRRLQVLLVRARDFGAAHPDGRADRRGVAEVRQINADYKQWNSDFLQWLETDASNFGIELPQNGDANRQK